jgi:hypothetical protein
MKDVTVIVLAIVGLIAIIAFLMMFPTYWLWNWLMPTIFGLKEITLWQALGLNLLSTILFKNTSSSSKKSD